FARAVSIFSNSSSDSGDSVGAIRRQFEHSSQKSPRERASSSRQFRTRAIIVASVCLPTPCGPARIKLCGRRPAASIRCNDLSVCALPVKRLNPICPYVFLPLYDRRPLPALDAAPDALSRQIRGGRERRTRVPPVQFYFRRATLWHCAPLHGLRAFEPRGSGSSDRASVPGRRHAPVRQ